MVEEFGLGNNVNTWVEAVYKKSPAKIDFCVYNSNIINPSRVVRQGCPLSLLLWISV